MKNRRKLHEEGEEGRRVEEGGRKGRRGVRAQLGTVHHDKQSTFGAVMNDTHSDNNALNKVVTCMP